MFTRQRWHFLSHDTVCQASVHHMVPCPGPPPSPPPPPQRELTGSWGVSSYSHVTCQKSSDNVSAAFKQWHCPACDGDVEIGNIPRSQTLLCVCTRRRKQRVVWQTGGEREGFEEAAIVYLPYQSNQNAHHWFNGWQFNDDRCNEFMKQKI